MTLLKPTKYLAYATTAMALLASSVSLTLPAQAKLTITPISSHQNDYQNEYQQNEYQYSQPNSNLDNKHKIANLKVTADIDDSDTQHYSMKFEHFLLSDLLSLFTLEGEYDIITARDLDGLELTDVNYENVSVSDILTDIMQHNNLTYRYIGDDLIFIYRDNAISACMYNTRVGGHSSDSLFDENKNLDKLAVPLSVDIDNISLAEAFKLIGDFTDYRVLIDNKLNLNQTYESLFVNNKQLNQILTALAYRNGFAYRYLDDNTVLISANPNIARCSGSEF